MADQNTVGNPSIVLLGVGNMGKALVDGWLHAGLNRLTLVDPLNLEPPPSWEGLPHVKDIAELPLTPTPDVVVLAVKPQVVEPVLLAARRLWRPSTVVVSIAAGVSIARLRQGVGSGVAVVRTMPNLGASVGCSVSVGVEGPGVSDTQKIWTERIMGAVGRFFWLQDEELLHAVTAISGSGPGYVFAFAEVLTNSARKLGIPHHLCGPLVRDTLLGSARILQDGEDPGVWWRRVASPGGTTEAAMAVLYDDARRDLRAVLLEAVSAACTRSVELASAESDGPPTRD